MKHSIYLLFILAILFSACSSSQKITSSWVNRDLLPKGPYKSIFILVITQNDATNFVVEDDMSKVIKARGVKTVKSTSIFIPNFLATGGISKEDLANAIKKAGCDAVFTIALLDTKTDQRYQQGTAYSPMGYGFYGSYYGYYNYYSPRVYSPGYYTTDKTYYIESNFYDLVSDQLLWSIQSEAYNPANLDSWFKSYSKQLLYQLKKEGLIKNKELKK
jgi:hypothetical protein